MATAEPCARIGIKPSVARTKGPSISTSAPVVESKHMVPKIALSQRRRNPLTPLIADQWQLALTKAHLMSKYPMIPMYIRQGAHARIPRIQKSYSPLNKISTEAQKNVFNEMIQAEFNKGRYIGPFSKEELEHEIGPFQSSPLSLVPKTGKPGKFHLIQNLSHPHTNLPTPSINTRLNSDDFPCTWGTFRTTCTLVRNLPPGAQAATRDIAEAYRIIPLHEDQWPGVVVRIANDTEMFALNTSNSFGCATAGGLFGLSGDALADLLRVRGIGPIVKWVDDFLFIRIPSLEIPGYNQKRNKDRTIVEVNGGRIQTGGRIWYKGTVLTEVGAEQFAEDLIFPIQHIEKHEAQRTTYPYDFDEIDRVTDPLGIPWEKSKDVPFSTKTIFAGFEWNLELKTVALPKAKREKYLVTIKEWRQKSSYTLEDTRKLYGKLLYTCHIIPQGRSYLTNFEKMMGTFHERPFTPRHAPKSLTEDIMWWHKVLTRPTLSRTIPGNRHIYDTKGFSDASSSTGLGIILGNRWRAWKLLPGWNQNRRDISWAEAITMELLIRTILQLGCPSGIKVHGDNMGVVEGWWTDRSRNAETNRVFRRIHGLLEENDVILTTQYVNTSCNPADDPSRGVFPPEHLLLPPITLPLKLRQFVTDFNTPSPPSMQPNAGSFPATSKPRLSRVEQQRRAQANTLTDELPDSATQTSAFE